MSIFRASRYVSTVDLIDIDALRAEGVRCLLLDRDNTLVPRSTKMPPPEVSAWLQRARDAGIATCMVSNNFHTREVCATAEELGCEVVHHAMKPLPIAVNIALQNMGVPREQAVLVGDQLFTDMAAGNLAGVRTILVRPQSQEDLWYTNIFRIAESALLRGVTFES